jgi:hypothetical protein
MFHWYMDSIPGNLSRKFVARDRGSASESPSMKSRNISMYLARQAPALHDYGHGSSLRALFRYAVTISWICLSLCSDSTDHVFRTTFRHFRRGRGGSARLRCACGGGRPVDDWLGSAANPHGLRQTGGDFRIRLCESRSRKRQPDIQCISD